MVTVITFIASFLLIMIAIRIKIDNSKKSKKDAEDSMGIINSLMYKNYGNN
jgi:amino acid permease